jgi:hypothetical protein
MKWIGMARTSRAMSNCDRPRGDSRSSIFAAPQNRIGAALPVLRPVRPVSFVPYSSRKDQVRRARHRIGAVARKDGFHDDARRRWTLAPEAPHGPAQGSQPRAQAGRHAFERQQTERALKQS